ncbi:MAG TPA: phosphoglucosamine mutase, partial [Coxiellaceae bacterium]|nr:phosphoglucosamine mutase [Coxiellaceae bacterium]
HNPYFDNGVKFFNAQGEKLSDAMELAIEALLDQPMTTVSPDVIADVKSLPDAGGRYSEFCKSTFPASLTLNGLKVVVDCAHGATYAVAPMIFHELGAEVITIGDAPNGLNINEGCGATELRALQAAVREHQADLGIALDGDGDRVMMVDHRGESVDGDELLCILTMHAHQQGCVNGVVGTLMTNWGFEKAMKQHAIPFIRASVGDRYVLEALKREGWKLGGESSGHLLNLALTTTGDGVISALQVLTVLKITGKSLNELKQCMQKTPQVMINVPIYRQPFEISHYPAIELAVQRVEEELEGSGRVLLRPSGTEPLVRVMVEGDSEEQVRRLAKTLADEVSQETA